MCFFLNEDVGTGREHVPRHGDDVVALIQGTSTDVARILGRLWLWPTHLVVNQTVEPETTCNKMKHASWVHFYLPLIFFVQSFHLIILGERTSSISNTAPLAPRSIAGWHELRRIGTWSMTSPLKAGEKLGEKIWFLVYTRIYHGWFQVLPCTVAPWKFHLAHFFLTCEGPWEPELSTHSKNSFEHRLGDFLRLKNHLKLIQKLFIAWVFAVSHKSHEWCVPNFLRTWSCRAVSPTFHAGHRSRCFGPRFWPGQSCNLPFFFCR